MADEQMSWAAAEAQAKELGKLGKSLVSAADLIRQAAQAERLLETHTTELEALRKTTEDRVKEREAIDRQIVEASDDLATTLGKVADAQKDSNIEIERLQRESAVAAAQVRQTTENETAKIIADRDSLERQFIQRRAEIKEEMAQERRRLEEELNGLRRSVQEANGALERVRREHADFVERISGVPGHA
jgi:dGTP triphosphohydrolase